MSHEHGDPRSVYPLRARAEPHNCDNIVRILVARAMATGLMWVAAGPLIFALFAYRETTLVSYYGFSEIETGDFLRRPMILTIGCLTGILSKALYDEFLKLKANSGFFAAIRRGLAPEKVAISILISPLIIMSVYTKIDQIPDLFMVALISYQTGFFFQTVLRPNSRRSN